jgi:hypothetical protein
MCVVKVGMCDCATDNLPPDRFDFIRLLCFIYATTCDLHECYLTEKSLGYASAVTIAWIISVGRSKREKK